MTDTELLDGLQRLFNGRGVVVLRTCRSGVKMELCDTDMHLPDAAALSRLRVREYFGGSPGAESPQNAGGMFGPDIRTAIARALREEAA